MCFSTWSSDVCSSDLLRLPLTEHRHQPPFGNLEPKAILIFGGDPARQDVRCDRQAIGQKIIEIQLLRGHSLIIPTACHPRRALSYSLFRTCECPECQTHAQPLRAPRRGRRTESHAKTLRRHVLVRASRAARKRPEKALRTVPALRRRLRPLSLCLCARYSSSRLCAFA